MFVWNSWDWTMFYSVGYNFQDTREVMIAMLIVIVA